MSAEEPRLPSWSESIARTTEELPGSDVLHCSVSTIGSESCVIVRWDFGRQGGTFGVAEADAFASAVHEAADRRLPLVTVIRTGGTRLPEGMRALVGIPRAALALADLRAAGVPHISVADNPTTGGVWVAIGSDADIRLAVAGAVVGFSGPRIVTAMTGRPLPEGGNTAESAYAAGLVDAVADHDDIGVLLQRALATLRPDDLVDAHESAPASAARPSGDDLITTLLTDRVSLRGADAVTSAAIGRLAGRRVVAVALAGPRGAMPGPGGFDLLSRAARLSGTLDSPLVVFVDTPGADPHREPDGLAASIGRATLAVLQTPAPSIALVHGDGGSGGALAGAVTDLVGVGEEGWFAAMGPVGAAAALRTSPEEAAALMRITPVELLADGFADAVVTPGNELTWCVAAIDALRAIPTEQRLAQRRTRWTNPLQHKG